MMLPGKPRQSTTKIVWKKISVRIQKKHNQNYTVFDHMQKPTSSLPFNDHQKQRPLILGKL